jgi:hypothetical protein
VERSGVRLDGSETEGEFGGLVDFVDVGSVGSRGTREDVALFEEANLFYVAIEIVGEHGGHARDE